MSWELVVEDKVDLSTFSTVPRSKRFPRMFLIVGSFTGNMALRAYPSAPDGPTSLSIVRPRKKNGTYQVQYLLGTTVGLVVVVDRGELSGMEPVERINFDTAGMSAANFSMWIRY